VAHSQRETALQYLLGELPEQHAMEFEEQWFAGDNLFEETSALENELVDSFIRGELSEAQRRQFEKGYLVSPARRANLEFSRLLAEHISAARLSVATTRPNPVSTFLFFQAWSRRFAWAMAVVVIVGISGIMVVNRRLRHELDSMSARQAEFQHQEQSLHQEILQLQSLLHPSGVGPRKTSGPKTTSLFLLPGTSRSGGYIHKIVIASVSPSVQIHLYLQHDDYGSYRAIIEDAKGRPIWKNNDELKSQAGAQNSRIVTIKMTSSILPNGDYLIKLEGKGAHGDFEGVEDYQFQVVRR